VSDAPRTAEPSPSSVPATLTRGREGRLVAVLSITETISWGIVYYAFAVFLTPMVAALGASSTTISGALSLALVVSALVGILVGKYLDHRGPRGLMTIGSLVSVLLVVAWSQTGSVLALYAVWVGLGCAMATVLYEPAFVVLAKWIPNPAARRRAMTTMTLAAALASFIFVPLAQLLLDRHGWRDAILALAAILAVTIPLHLLLPAGTPPTAPGATGRPSRGAVRRTVRRTDFQRLTLGYFLASFAGIALLVLVIPFLSDRGYSTGFAAFALGTIGAAQIPGRLLLSVSGRWLASRHIAPMNFALVGLGLLLVLVAPYASFVLAGTIVLGMGNGMTTLSRATIVADRFGTADYGAVAGIAAAATTAARAISPVAATAVASLVGIEALIGVLIACAAAAVAATTGLADAPARA
jgi:predicted MFS family arabinose efflux permease